MERIMLIATGGTIAKTYGSGKGVRDLHIGDFDELYSVRHVLERMALSNAIDVQFKQLLQKDSLDITDEDRQLIVETCFNLKNQRVIITHGTDTMVKTAEGLANLAAGLKQTIVLTGSLLPACVRDTDAEFNLGLALGACLYAPPGVYIAMNGVHLWNQCAKHAETGFFDPV
jgi:L-asparaginase